MAERELVCVQLAHQPGTLAPDLLYDEVDDSPLVAGVTGSRVGSERHQSPVDSVRRHPVDDVVGDLLRR